MLDALVRSVFLTLIRIFFREISVSYVGERPPPDNPTLIVANHPNGLIDPLVMQIALGRQVRFLGKSTLFDNWFGRTAMNAFAGIPVYRSKDGKDTSKNSRTFELVGEALEQNAWIALFPEGISHDEPTLQPLKTGAARMYLDAVNRRSDAQIVAVGLDYEQKARFRSRVAVTVGEPLDATGDPDDRADVTSLTTRIAESISDLTLEAGSSELKEGFVWVARWLEGDAASIKDIDRGSKALADAYTRLLETDQSRADALVEEIREFARRLESVGLNAWELDGPLRIASFVPYLFGFPIAVVGAILSYPTYKFIGPFSERMSGGERDIVSTIKGLAGLLFFPVTWSLEVLAAWFVSPIFGLAVALAVVPTSWFALHYFERLQTRRRALRAFGFRTLAGEQAKVILRGREDLARKIEATLHA